MSHTDNDELDMSWVKEEERLENLDSPLVLEHLNSVNVAYVYMDADLAIQNVVYDKEVLEDLSVLGKDRILKLVQTHREPGYRFMEMFMFFIDVGADDLDGFLEEENAQCGRFIRQHKMFDDLIIPQSLFVFHSSQCIYFLYKGVPAYSVPVPAYSGLRSSMKHRSSNDNGRGLRQTKRVHIDDTPPVIIRRRITHKVCHLPGALRTTRKLV